MVGVYLLSNFLMGNKSCFMHYPLKKNIKIPRLCVFFSSPLLKGTVMYHFPIYFRVIPEAHLTVPFLIKLDYPNMNCVELYPGEPDVRKKNSPASIHEFQNTWIG